MVASKISKWECGLNGRVERAQRIQTKEFYEVIPDSFHLPTLHRDLQAWKRIYNPVRPHQNAKWEFTTNYLRKD